MIPALWFGDAVSADPFNAKPEIPLVTVGEHIYTFLSSTAEVLKFDTATELWSSVAVGSSHDASKCIDPSGTCNLQNSQYQLSEIHEETMQSFAIEQKCSDGYIPLVDKCKYTVGNVAVRVFGDSILYRVSGPV